MCVAYASDPCTQLGAHPSAPTYQVPSEQEPESIDGDWLHLKFYENGDFKAKVVRCMECILDVWDVLEGEFGMAWDMPIPKFDWYADDDESLRNCLLRLKNHA